MDHDKSLSKTTVILMNSVPCERLTGFCVIDMAKASHKNIDPNQKKTSFELKTIYKSHTESIPFDRSLKIRALG